MTNRMKLEASWARTTAHLERAVALLPSKLTESDETGRLDRYKEWIAHNELRLGLDELEGLGQNNPVPVSFWEHLRLAAEEMHLHEQAARFRARGSGKTG